MLYHEQLYLFRDPVPNRRTMVVAWLVLDLICSIESIQLRITQYKSSLHKQNILPNVWNTRPITSSFKANMAVYQVQRRTKSNANKQALNQQNSLSPLIPDLAPRQKIVISVKQSQASIVETELSSLLFVLLKIDFVYLMCRPNPIVITRNGSDSLAKSKHMSVGKP